MSDLINKKLPIDIETLLKTYVTAVKAQLGAQLEGVLLYGSAVRGEFLLGRSNLNILLLLASYDSALLKQYGTVHRHWSKEQIVVPLLLTEAELQVSASVFPLEFLEIQDHHRLLGGRDPFSGLEVKTDRLRDVVVQGLFSHLLRLRQRVVEGGASDDATLMLLPLSITSLVPLLRGILRLRGRPVLPDSISVIESVGTLMEVDLQGLRDAWLLKRGQISPGPSEVSRLFDRYLEGVTRLTSVVQQCAPSRF